jgi:hypothetical protein
VHEEAHVPFVRIVVEVVHAVCVEQAGAALDAVDGVAAVEQEFRQVGAILARDSGDEGSLGHRVSPGVVTQTSSAPARNP